MSRRSSCRCDICHYHGPLLRLLESSQGIEGYRELLRSHPALDGFPTVTALADFTRKKQKSESGRKLEDRIYRALLSELHRDHSALAGTLLVFLFLYSLHDVLKAVSRSYRILESEDIAQETFAYFFARLRSRDLRDRTEFLGRAISERTNRDVYRWAGRASRIVLEGPVSATVPESELAREHDPELLFLHFLSKGIRQGWLSREEADLLSAYEIAGDSGEELGNRIGLSAKAVRSRVRRLLARLRQRLKELRKKRGTFLPG